MATMYVLLVCMFCLCVCFVPVLSLLCYTYIRAYISCHLISSFMKGVKELYLLKLVANVSATSFIKVYNIKWTIYHLTLILYTDPQQDTLSTGFSCTQIHSRTRFPRVSLAMCILSVV